MFFPVLDVVKGRNACLGVCMLSASEGIIQKIRNLVRNLKAIYQFRLPYFVIKKIVANHTSGLYCSE